MYRRHEDPVEHEFRIGSELPQNRPASASPNQFSADFLIDKPTPRPSRLSKLIPRKMSQIFDRQPSKSPPPVSDTAPAPFSSPSGACTPQAKNSFDGERTARGGSPTALPGPSRASQDVDPDLRESNQEVQCKSQSSQNWRTRSSRLAQQFEPAFVLENSGSVARDHLASERTYLAYMRTSLAIASTGVALVQLFSVAVSTDSNHDKTFTPITKRVQAFARPLGAATIVFGLMVLITGIARYFAVQTALTKGMFPVARITITGSAVILATLIVIVFGVLVSERA